MAGSLVRIGLNPPPLIQGLVKPATNAGGRYLKILKYQ
jgi:hypothetical protein